MGKVAPNDESMRDKDLNLVNGLEVANLDSSTVPVANAFEASKENWKGETYEHKKGTSSLSEEKIPSLGQIFLDKESRDDDQESAEIISTTASPLENSDESHDEKLLDIDLSEDLKLAQSSDLGSGFAIGDTIQTCSNDAFVKPTSSEMANDESEINVLTDKETGTTLLDEEPLFSNLEMHLVSRDNDNESANCSHEKDGKDIDESSTDEIAKHKLHFQNKIDSSNEILKESDVMEIIQEYINSESSKSNDIEHSGVTLPIKASTEESKISSSVDEPCEDTILDEVSALRRVSTAKKTARTILIHGTPSKALVMADMKENDTLKKKPQIGDITTTRPAKRRALQDILFK